jgi:U6 snRNA-associated Sm-like protein LSm1
VYCAAGTSSVGSAAVCPLLRIDDPLTRKPIANLVLQDTTERIFVQDLYADVKHGVYIVRGENVLLLGEIVRYPIMLSAACLPFDQDLDQEDDVPEPFREAPLEKVRELMRAETEKKKKRDAVKAKLLRGRGFEGDLDGESIA